MVGVPLAVIERLVEVDVHAFVDRPADLDEGIAGGELKDIIQIEVEVRALGRRGYGQRAGIVEEVNAARIEADRIVAIMR